MPGFSSRERRFKAAGFSEGGWQAARAWVRGRTGQAAFLRDPRAGPSTQVGWRQVKVLPAFSKAAGCRAEPYGLPGVRGVLVPGGHRSGPTEAAAETSPSAPATKPAETLGFCRFTFFMCCMVLWFTLVRTLGFLIWFDPFSTVPIPSSTQNAPGFAFFWLNRVRFALFDLF